MSRKLATIRLIKEINEIPDSSNIELALVDGWQVVVKKDEFKANDKCIFCEIDSYLPIKPEFEFLRKSSYKAFPNGVEGFRLRSCRLRNQLSQGLVLPLNIIKSFKIKLLGYPIGYDVTDILGIRLYDPEALGQANRSWLVRRYNQIKWLLSLIHITKAQAKLGGDFPSFIRKTDEERIQNLDFDKLKGHEYEISEKVDGSSITVFVNNGEFGVCSRNKRVGTDDNGAYWTVVKKYKLDETLPLQPFNIAIQGEVIGPKIQGNKYKLTEHELLVFKIFDIDKGRYADANTRLTICKNLGLRHVPIIEERVFDFANIKDALDYAEGKSVVCHTTEREGVVFKSLDGVYSFKVINNKFLLKNEE
jgi:hypothetical protein